MLLGLALVLMVTAVLSSRPEDSSGPVGADSGQSAGAPGDGPAVPTSGPSDSADPTTPPPARGEDPPAEGSGARVTISPAGPPTAAATGLPADQNGPATYAGTPAGAAPVHGFAGSAGAADRSAEVAAVAAGQAPPPTPVTAPTAGPAPTSAPTRPRTLFPTFPAFPAPPALPPAPEPPRPPELGQTCIVPTLLDVRICLPRFKACPPTRGDAPGWGLSGGQSGAETSVMPAANKVSHNSVTVPQPQTSPEAIDATPLLLTWAELFERLDERMPTTDQLPATPVLIGLLASSSIAHYNARKTAQITEVHWSFCNDTLGVTANPTRCIRKC